MEINIEDYLTKDEIKEIAKEQLSNSFKNLFRKESDVKRILVNLSYEYVFQLVDSMWDNNFEEFLKTKIQKCLEEIDLGFYIFRRQNIYGDKDSPAIKILDEEVEKARPLIRKKIEEKIEKYPFHELDKEEISWTITDVIMEQIFNKKKNEGDSRC